MLRIRVLMVLAAAMAAPAGDGVAQTPPTPRPNVDERPNADADRGRSTVETAPLAPPAGAGTGAEAGAEAGAEIGDERSARVGVYDTFREPAYSGAGESSATYRLERSRPGEFKKAPEFAERDEENWGDENRDRAAQGVGAVIRAERPVSRSEERPFAVLRGIDKISGLVSDIKAPIDEAVKYQRLTITVDECREPPPDEPDDAFAFLKIRDAKSGPDPVFSGWMFASSPALSAMDHQRYDVWVLSCATS